MEEANPLRAHKGNSRQRGLVVLAALLVAGVVTFVFVSKAQERKEFISRFNPASGYRCRFTLASDWKRSVEESRLQAGGGFEYEVFHRTMTLPRRWNENHLRPRPVPGPQTLTLVAIDIAPTKSAGPFHIVEGYPERTSNEQMRIVTRHHLQISGYPATFCEFEGVAPATCRGSYLLVYVPEQSLLYAVFGYEESSNSVQVNREMQAIIASFHIEKVTDSK